MMHGYYREKLRVKREEFEGKETLKLYIWFVRIDIGNAINLLKDVSMSPICIFKCTQVRFCEFQY